MERWESLRVKCSAGLLMLATAAASCTAILGIDKDYREGTGGSGGAGGASGPSTSTSGAGGSSSTSSGMSSSSAQSSSGSGGMCAPPSCTGCADCQSCETCAYAAMGPCHTEYTTCAGNPECVALINCVDACSGDPACQNGCVGSHPGGAGDLLALAMCAASACPPCAPP